MVLTCCSGCFITINTKNRAFLGIPPAHKPNGTLPDKESIVKSRSSPHRCWTCAQIPVQMISQSRHLLILLKITRREYSMWGHGKSCSYPRSVYAGQTEKQQNVSRSLKEWWKIFARIWMTIFPFGIENENEKSREITEKGISVSVSCCFLEQRSKFMMYFSL